MVLIDPTLRQPPAPPADPSLPPERRSPIAGLLRLHGYDINRLQRLFDPLLCATLFALFDGSPTLIEDRLLLPPWLWVLLLTALILPRAKIYSSYRERNLFSLARRLTSCWSLVFTGLLVLSYITKTTSSFSRINTSLWAIVTLTVLLGEHVGMRQLLRWHRRRGGNSRTILYWGNAAAAVALQKQLLDQSWMGLHMVAWFSPVAVNPAEQPEMLPPCAGGLAEMRAWLRNHHVDRIVFSHLATDAHSMDHLLQLFGDTCLPVIYAPDWALNGMRFQPSSIGAVHCIELWGSEGSLIDRQLKRTFDLVLTTIGLVLISPLLLAIAMAVAGTSPGPVLFAQDRYGLDGRRFRIYKFRTMRVMEAGDQPGLQQACRLDPRVTPVGRFLRQWSLDELPQLFNVIKGDMSLVGPRPHAVDHNEQYRRLIPGYMQRHAFKPGITGLAQIEGWRGETSQLCSMVSRVEADLRYQRDWSLKLDIKILIMTLLRLRSPNAY